MAPGAMSRRSFLAATAGLVVAASCGGGSSTKAKRNLSALFLSSDLYASPQPQRVGFALAANGGEFASGPPAKLAVQPPGGRLGPFVATTLHANGLPKRRGIYTAEVTLPTAGNWPARVEVEGKVVPLAFEVKPTPTAPAIGAPAPRAPSPTTTNTLGVDPICTRVPACPLHTVSLETVIGQGKPVAVMFGTPLRCESRYCGPVLDALLPLVPRYQDKITFVHVEIYMSASSQDLIPTVEAWKLESEPWLFCVDASGNVAERIDGAFGQDEMKTMLDRLAAT